jgi:hypothetical protein
LVLTLLTRVALSFLRHKTIKIIIKKGQALNAPTLCDRFDRTGAIPDELLSSRAHFRFALSLHKVVSVIQIVSSIGASSGVILCLSDA